MQRRLVAAACAVALLHFGRPMLEPVALAGILAAALVPAVQRLRAFGLGHAVAAFVCVGLLGAGVVAAGATMAVQFAAVAAELPRYRNAIAAKADRLSAVALRPIEKWQEEIAALAPELPEAQASRHRAASAPIPVEIRQAPASSSGTLLKALSAAWGPIAEAFIVLVLLVFILLGQDSIRDRLARLAGEVDAAGALQVLADTDAGVSRFFASLLAVNATFAFVAGVALWLAGVPHAALWGGLAGLLRFVPYLGVPSAAAIVALFAAAADPGWWLMLRAVGIFAVMELATANAIEPRVYGRSTGLAPLGIIVATLFWGALWGPVGLLLSTPLTLCLVVAGRHVAALAPFAILLEEAPRAPPAPAGSPLHGG